VKIDALYVHPIKSCAPVAVNEARVTRRGLEHDRRWMVADSDGKFLSQRTLPELALVHIAIDGERYVVRRQGRPALLLPLRHDDGAGVDVEVWGDHVRALRHDHGSDWFSRLVGGDVQLVFMPDDTRRPVDPDYARADDIVNFADGFPLLVVNRASLEALGRDAGIDVDVRRFRPNVVVTGAAAWAEDDWRALAVGDGSNALTLRTPKPCARCSIPGVDPETAAITKEPLRTLAKLRTRDNQAWFGINAIPDGEGRLRVGDSVRPLDSCAVSGTSRRASANDASTR
jgi:uncharacterized protein YcbX